ncbi:MAG: CsbD family protein [Anaerolineae bacterium]|nr:CsbD family protein [Anaerolineae bacterium]
MPWTISVFPSAMKNFPPAVREKAIEIANALLDEGYVEERAIPIAIAQAKRWAEGNDDKEASGNLHVVPHPEGWAIHKENAEHEMTVFPNLEDARNEAIGVARNEGVDVVLYSEDGHMQDHVSLLDEVRAKVKQTETDEEGVQLMANQTNSGFWDRVAGKWHQWKGDVRTKWGRLTDDDLEQIAGHREKLAGKIQERYGMAKDDVNRQLDEWEQSFEAERN